MKTPGEAVGELVQRFVEAAWPKDCERAPVELYALVIRTVEKPLIAAVLERTKGNQSRAALALGISRNTLRAILTRHDYRGIG